MIISSEFKNHIAMYLNLDYMRRGLLLKFLVLDCGLNVNYRNNYETPLSVALGDYDYELVKLLIVELEAYINESCYNFIINAYHHHPETDNNEGMKEIYEIVQEKKHLYFN